MKINKRDYATLQLGTDHLTVRGRGKCFSHGTKIRLYFLFGHEPIFLLKTAG